MNEGTIKFLIKHPDPDWASNSKAYKFGPFEQGEIGISAFKKADLTLEIRFASEHFGHTFSGPLPSPTDKGIDIIVSWKSGNEITLWVNGTKVQSAPYLPTRH